MKFSSERDVKAAASEAFAPCDAVYPEFSCPSSQLERSTYSAHGARTSCPTYLSTGAAASTSRSTEQAEDPAENREY